MCKNDKKIVISNNEMIGGCFEADIIIRDCGLSMSYNVEIDGLSHSGLKGRLFETCRDAYVHNECGYKVIRVPIGRRGVEDDFQKSARAIYSDILMLRESRK